MLLSLVTFFPVFVALIVLIMPKAFARHLAIVGSLGTFLVSLLILKIYDPSTFNLQLVEQIPWVPDFGISYFMGIDGISLWLVMLTSFLTPLVVIATWNSFGDSAKGFHINILLLQAAMTGTFLAMDAVLFYIFFEASLVPMYFIIGIWGGTRRLYATFKFFIYTMAGSVLMLIAIITLMVMTENQFQQMSASILDFYRLKIPFVAGELLNPQTLMFIAFSVAFAIKVPMFPFHTWLPDAHVEAPTPGSVILAAVMLKMGTYGFIRFVVPLFPDATAYWGWVFLLLGVIGIIYGALVAMVQPDMKKLVAYSSVSHMGYVVIGIFALNLQGLTGALYQMLNHGVSTGALFLLVGMIYERTHSREISKYGGLAMAMPIYAIFFFIITLSSIAVPGTNGFVGEFLILLGTYSHKPVYGVLAATGVIFGASYMLWMFKKVFFGTAGELVPEVATEAGHGNHSATASHGRDSGHEKHPLVDLSLREIFVLVPLVVLVFWMGIFPNHFLSYSQASLDHMVKNLTSYQIVVNPTNENLGLVARLRGNK